MNAGTQSVSSIISGLCIFILLVHPAAHAQYINTLVNNPAFDTTARDTQSETAIALANNNVLIAFNNSVCSIGGASQFTGFSVSTNNGSTFTDQRCLPASVNGDAGDPVLARDNTTGTIYLSTLMFTGSGVQVFRSTDSGATFGVPVNGAPGFGGGDFLDKEWIATDNFLGAGQGNVYLVFRNLAGGGPGSRANGIYFTRSIDGGQMWTNPAVSIINSNLVQGAYVTVGPNHTVYVFWLDQGSPLQIRMSSSTNQGLTFGAPVTVSILTGGMGGDLGLNGGFRTNSFPQATVNPVNGNLYVVFNDVGIAAGDRADVYFSQSTDGGATWSTRVRVNDDTTINDQWQPALAVSPNGLHLFVGFYDRRLDPANALIDRFGVVADIAGSTVRFRSNIRITTESFPVVIGQDPAVVPNYMGDYDQIVGDYNFSYNPWGDNRLATGIHTHQPDVRFTRMFVNTEALMSIVNSILSRSRDGGM
jgi:hypothetical protein